MEIVEDYPRGYPRLAAFQSSDDDFLAFRRFATAHTRCLLLAQDEILSIEEKLQRLDGAERVQLYLSSREHDANPERQAVLKELREKLREYGQCDIQLESVTTLLAKDSRQGPAPIPTAELGQKAKRGKSRKPEKMDESCETSHQRRDPVP